VREDERFLRDGDDLVTVLDVPAPLAALGATLKVPTLEGEIDVEVSAGTQPGERVHPEVQAAMAEVGIDLSGAKPQRLTEELARGAHWLITMGCGQACPHVPGLKRDDWPLEDPKGKPVERVREIRDEVRSRVSAFLVREGWLR